MSKENEASPLFSEDLSGKIFSYLSLVCTVQSSGTEVHNCKCTISEAKLFILYGNV